MRCRMLFKLGVSLVVTVAVVMFYLVHQQGWDDQHSTAHREMLREVEGFVRGNKVDNSLHSKGTDDIIHDRGTENLSQEKARVPGEVGSVGLLEEQEQMGTDIGGGQGPDEAGNDENVDNVRAKLPRSEGQDSFELGQEVPGDIPRTRKSTHLTPVFSREVSMAGRSLHLCVVVCGDRDAEAIVMLKSAAMVTPDAPLVFHILADTEAQGKMQLKLESWPLAVTRRVGYRIYNVTFPASLDSQEKWRTLFKPCASVRLFLPHLLGETESLIYVDTDALFLGSLTLLWSHFEQFNVTQLAALSQEAEDRSYGWDSRFSSHPYYGKYGLNSAVMLMNLTRLRQSKWGDEIPLLYDKYRYVIPWGDQDLINIYFAKYPEQLMLMACRMNYRNDHCRYMSICQSAKEHGVSVLHGSRGIFHSDKEPMFAAVYKAFEQHPLEESLEFSFLPDLEQLLLDSKPSTCGQVKHLLMPQLERVAKRLAQSQGEGA